MSHERTVRRMIDAWSDQDYETVEELYTQNAVERWPGGAVHEGVDALKEAEAAYRSAFPDYELEVLGRVFTGDEWAAHRWRGVGTHEGEFNGVEPTGTEVEYEGMAIHAFDGDRIAESWWIADRLAQLRQIGAVDVEA